MPRIRGLTSDKKVEYQRQLLTHKCDVLLYDAGVSKAEVADYMDCSVQAIYKQFKTNAITLPVLIAVATLTNATDELVGYLKVGDR